MIIWVDILPHGRMTIGHLIKSMLLLEDLVHYCPASHGTWSLYDEG